MKRNRAFDMNVEFWNSVFQWGSVGLIAITFFFGAGALWTSNRINDRQTARLIVLESDLSKARTLLSEQQERTAKIEIEAAAQRERAAKAEADLLEVKSRITPRHLTADQRDQLIARLRARPKGSADIVCPSNDHEACVFSEELQSVLNDAGWATSFVNAVLVRVPTGVQISQRDEGDALLHVKELYAGFRAFGIDTSVVFDPSVSGTHAKVLVGRKP
jgi:hypothetical protein